jgi:TRAP-type C4-dicarboxylate transport system permease small subunit
MNNNTPDKAPGENFGNDPGNQPGNRSGNNATSALSRIHSGLVQTENWILVLILVSMLVIAVLQIFLRNFFGFGIVWAETLVRVLVLWTALIGAMVATRNGKHINIDILTRYLPDKSKFTVLGLVNLFTACICGIISYYSVYFVYLEYQDASLAFAQVPNWVCESIIPLAFLIMAVRYLFAFVIDVITLTNNKNIA